jgi:NAD(P)-dependent dehydrogenase (short-subunit alcohol dehydrogenase family)
MTTDLITCAETAATVTEAGGRGIAVTVDHTDDATVTGLFTQIANERGRLVILVNNASKLVGTTAPGSF